MNFSFHIARPRARAAFSLVEVIAVIAIMAILAAVMVPVLIRQVDFTAQAKEAADMDLIVRGLQQGTARTRFIPLNNPTNWATFVATNSGMEISAVLTNTFSRNPRAFLVDRGLTIGATAATDPGYQQPVGGATSSASPRLIILSSMSAGLPFVSGVAPNAADFNALWNNPDGSVPSGMPWDTWKTAGGDPHDLIIRRVNLAGDFVHVMLTNMDSIVWATNLVDGATNAIPPQAGIDTFFLAGTVLSLLGDVQTSQVLQHDGSWIFQHGMWRIQAAGPSTYGGTYGPLQPVVQTFLNNPSYNSVATANVVQHMQDYMSAYHTWANASFPTNGALKSAVVNAADILNGDLNTIVR